MLTGSRSRLSPGRTLGRELAMVFLLAQAKEQPILLSSVTAVMQVTYAAANMNTFLPDDEIFDEAVKMCPC